MAARTILHWPNPRLQQTAQQIDQIDEKAIDLARDLYDSMTVEFGAGLAATQLGILQSMVVISSDYSEDTTLDVDPKLPDAIVLVNPNITHFGDDKFVWEEACLSVPDFSEMVERHSNITLEYLDLTGASHTRELGPPFSGIVQHEVDHLSGKLYIDRLSPPKRKNAVRVLRMRIKRQKLEAAKKRKWEAQERRQEGVKKGFRVFSSKTLSRKKRPGKCYGKNKRKRKR